MEFLLLVSLLIGFLVTLFVLPFWIKKAREIGLEWDDCNKYYKVKAVGSGGIAVVTGFLAGVFFYIALNTFYFKSSENVIQIFAITSSILITFAIGLIDGILGWKGGMRRGEGIRRRWRILLVLVAAVPLIVINAGSHSVLFPFLNGNTAWIYPLILIPLGIVGASTTFNFLAGFNGLEAGQGIIILSALSIVAYFTGSSWLALIGLIMIVCLFGFIFYNFYPAKVFPGDTLTYPVGTLIAIMAILGNFEKVAIFFFIPYILEVILKLRGKLEKQSFGKPNKDNGLDLRYDKFYGLEHIAIWFLNKSGIKATEKKVVYTIWAFQILIVIIGFIIFREGIFL